MDTPTQSEKTSQVPVQPKPTIKSAIDSRMSILLIIFGFLILLVIIGGAYHLGTQKNNISMNNNPPTPNQQLTPEPTVNSQNSPSVTSTSNVNQLTQKPTISNTTVAIPSDWEQYTATDPDFGVTTTMSMPPGYQFRFTGSEFTIQNDSDATELWDYSTSVYRDNEGVLKNHYDGSSRRVWYEKRLSERQISDKIISVTEKPLNATTYLEIVVQTPSYNDRGVSVGTKNGMHYVYVQNNILHIIAPASNKAYTSSAQIPDNIGSILASLTSVQTK